MTRLVEPEVFLVARPSVDYDELAGYLHEVGGESWLERLDRDQLSPQDLAEFARGCATSRSSPASTRT